ncbi:zinc-binding alcohol dehydrogenase family protein [Cellulosimicrobium sp. CUA-896]|uniref:zinc-binding alcohol dehydrogenase family protein n=1 Tax=Cellulosimicrobium sp. CUA-896 TaxID=1517881 RepID=UPI0009610B39|nr:zinc-binding alcohol dehydrogenase family protein [Cellulosimicrobium sp. CUA-896]OLT55123.1 NADPH:quinone reductase [Cellulosimicrobium sp. CUA-896]
MTETTAPRSSAPTLMRAIGYTASRPADDPAALVERAVPRPHVGPHDLLVEVRAVSVNPVDVKQRAHAGAHGFRVLGYDAAGVVTAKGEAVTLFDVGDHVYYAGALDRPGTNSQLHAVDERIVGRKPASLGWADAAALPLTTLTAYEALFHKLRLTATSAGTLLVVGAAGGVGSIMIQLAKVLAPGVRVIGTASRPESQAWVTSLGADAVVDHHGDLAANVLSAAPDGVDWIFTAASAKPGAVEAYVRIAKPFGQVVAIDDPHHLDVVSLKSKALSWHWEFMFARSMHHAADMIEQHRILDHVAELVDEGLVRTTATERLSPLDPEHLLAAHRIVESGRSIGKVVVSDE